MAQYKSYTHVLRIDKDEVQGILCGDVVVMPKLDGTNACLFMKDGTVHAGSRTREINMNKDNANFCKTLTLNGEKEFPQIIQYLESHPDHIVYGEWLGADGEGDETEADGLPAYQEELVHVKDVLCRTAEKFSLDKDCTRITKMSLSDEWISLYNHDEKDGRLDVEVEVAVNATFELQFKKLSKNEYKEANAIDDRLFCVLNEFSVLAHGHAMLNSCSYE